MTDNVTVSDKEVEELNSILSQSEAIQPTVETVLESIVNPEINEDADPMSVEVQAGSRIGVKQSLDQLKELYPTFNPDEVLGTTADVHKKIMTDVFSAENISQEQQQAVANFIQSVAIDRKLQDARMANISTELSNIDTQIRGLVNEKSGTIVDAFIHGDETTPVRIKGGLALQFDESNTEKPFTPDLQNSDGTVYYVDANGDPYPTIADNLEVISSRDVDEVVQQEQAAFLEEQSKFDADVERQIAEYFSPAPDYVAGDMAELPDGSITQIMQHNPDGSILLEVQQPNGDTNEIVISPDELPKFGFGTTTQESNNTVEENETSPEEAEKSAFMSSLPVIESGKDAGEFDHANFTAEQNLKYSEYEYGKDETLSSAEQQVANLKKSVEKEGAKLKANPFDFKQKQKVADLHAELKTYSDYVFAEKQARTEQRIAESEPTSVLDAKTRQSEKIQSLEAGRTGTASASIIDKWNNSPKVEGIADVITLANGEKITGKYVLTSAGALSPSHNVFANFTKTDGFPTNEQGKTVNDRDYEADQTAQTLVQQRANNYDERAVQTPVVVSNEGIVLSGNDRTMSGQLAAKQGTDGSYTDYITQYANRWGFTPEQIQTIENPRIVFVPDETLPYNTRTFAKFNAEEKKTQNSLESAIKASKSISKEVIIPLSSVVEQFNKLSDFYNDPQAAKQVIDILLQNKIIGTNEVAKMMDGNLLSVEGRSFLETLMLGSILNETALRQIDKMRSVRQTLMRAMPQLIRNAALTDYSLTEELNNAIALLYDARQNGNRIELQLMQGNLFDATAEEIYSETEKVLSLLLQNEKDTEFRRIFDTYNSRAVEIESGQSDIFEGVLTKPELLQKILDRYGQNEQQAVVGQRTADDGEQGTGEQEKGVEQVGSVDVVDSGRGIVPSSELGENKEQRAKNKDGEEIQPIGEGVFGKIYDQFKGKANKAVKFLIEQQGGEAIGALHHPEIGDIDLVWGKEGTGKSDGYGLAKIVKFHPEVVENLQDILSEMKVAKRTDNRVNLESEKYQAAVRLEWDNVRKNWLLTAFEKRNIVSDSRTDIVTEPTEASKQNDTATLQNDIPNSKDNTEVSEKQEKDGKSSEFRVPSSELADKQDVKFTKEYVKERLRTLNDYSDVENLLKDFFGEKVLIVHATTKEGYEDIIKNGLRPVDVKNRKTFSGDDGFYVQAFKSDEFDADKTYQSDSRPYLLTAEIDTEELGYADPDTDGAVSSDVAMNEIGITEEDWDIMESGVKDFISTVISYDYNMNGFEFLFRNEMLSDDFSPIKMKLYGENPGAENTTEEHISPTISKMEIVDIVSFAENAVKNNEIAKEAEKVDTNPTDGQKEAGNYKKGHVRVQGFDITIENPKGSVRSGIDKDGKAWEITMQNHYGYFKRTEGKDGDHIDVFVGDYPLSEKIFVIDQNNPETKEFDESKVMLGFSSVDEAKKAYMSNYEDNWQGFGAITETTVDEFKRWLYDGAKQRKAFGGYREVIDKQAEKRRAIAQEVQRAIGIDINLVESADELPDSEGKAKRAIDGGSNVKAWYNPKTNQAYLYVPNITDRADAERSILHEVVAHKGLRDLLGQERFDGLCDKVYDSIGRRDKVKYGSYVLYGRADVSLSLIDLSKIFGDTETKRAIADEYMSHLAEGGVNNPTVWDKIVDWVRELLRDIGFDVHVSERDIRYMLGRSRENLQSQSKEAGENNLRRRVFEHGGAVYRSMADGLNAVFEQAGIPVQLGEEQGDDIRFRAISVANNEANRDRNKDREAYKKAFKRNGEAIYDTLHQTQGGLLATHPMELLAFLKDKIGSKNTALDIIRENHDWLRIEFEKANKSLLEGKEDEVSEPINVFDLARERGFELLEHTMDNGKAIGVKGMYRDKFEPSGKTDREHSPSSEHYSRSVICYYNDPDSRLRSQYVFTVEHSNAVNTPTAYELKANPSLMTPEWEKYLEENNYPKKADGSFDLRGLKPNITRDPFATSFLMVRVNKGASKGVEIISRYNHGAFGASGEYISQSGNSNAVYGNKLDKVFDGFRQALFAYKGIKVGSSEVELSGSVRMANNGRLYKVDREIDGIYLGDGFYIDRANNATELQADRQFLVERYLFENNSIKDVTSGEYVDVPDIHKMQIGANRISFYYGGETVVEHKQIKMPDGTIKEIEKKNWSGDHKVELNNGDAYVEGENIDVITSIASNARSLVAPNIEIIGDDFLHNNQSLESLELPNLQSVGNWFLCENQSLASLSLPNLQSAGDYFLQNNQSLESLSLPNLQSVRDAFLSDNRALTSLSLPNLQSVGSWFLNNNRVLTSLELPNLQSVENAFLSDNRALTSLSLPNLQSAGDYFLRNNQSLESLELPNLQSVGSNFLRNNQSLTNIEMPKHLSDKIFGSRQRNSGTDVRFRLTDEEQEIKSEAITSGTFMKAPNGKETNLNEKQWLQVRTKAFKKWFGDWEKAARIEKLRNAKPVDVSFKGEYELNRDSAKAYIKDNLRGEYVNKDTNESIRVSRIGANKVTSHGERDEAHLKSIVAIPQMIDKAIFIEELSNQKGNDKYETYRYYVVGLKIADVDYTAKIVVGKRDNMWYYDHDLTQIEKGSLINATQSTNSLDKNQTPLSDYKDRKLISLLQTNSSKVVDENGEPMVVYHGTAADIDEVSSSFKNGFFTNIKEAAEEFGDVIPAFLNIRTAKAIDFNYGDYNSYPIGFTDNNGDYYEYDPYTEDVDFNTYIEDFAKKYDVDINDLEVEYGDYDGLGGSIDILVTNAKNSNKYDGAIFKNVAITGYNYIAFSPSQIKSATDNIGTFDAGSDDMRYRIAGERGDASEQLRVKKEELKGSNATRATERQASAVVEQLKKNGLPGEVVTVKTTAEAKRFIDERQAEEAAKYEKTFTDRWNAVEKVSKFIGSVLSGTNIGKSIKIDLPENINKLAEQAVGHKINSHRIKANEIIHARNRHGITGTGNTESSIPLRDSDFTLMPYIMTAPTRVEKGTTAVNGTESVRYEKELSDGVVVVVEREGRFDVEDMENITMWATKKSATKVADAKQASHNTSETIVLSEADVAKIKKDAETAIKNNIKSEDTEYQYQNKQGISDKQYEKASEVLKALHDAGFNDFHISRSITDFGVSTYIQGQLGLKFRISDHSVTRIDRILNEIHFGYDTTIQSLVDEAKKADSRAKERAKAFDADEERTRLANEKWDRIKSHFNGVVFKRNNRTYQDYETFRNSGERPRTNILQTEQKGGYGQKAFSYEWTEPTEYNKWGFPTNEGSRKPSRDFIEAFDENSLELNTTRYHAVWHGSPHEFKSFDFSKMGSGEGSQVFGWGGYVTEVKGIGKVYAESNVSDKHKENRNINNLARETIENSGGKEAALDYLNSLLNESWSDKKRVKAQIKIIEKGKFLDEGKSNLYEVSIPDDDGTNYLHWEKPFSQQVEGVRARINEHKEDENVWGIFVNFDVKEQTGEYFYKRLSYELGSDKAASEFLSRAGFTGISYPAEYTSGGREDGKRNYVIFDEKDMTITNHTQWALGPNGEIAGATLPDGTVILVSGNMTVDTPFHEFAHKLRKYAKSHSELANLAAAIDKYAAEAPQHIKEYVKRTYGYKTESDVYMDEAYAWALSMQNKDKLIEFLKERGVDTSNITGLAETQAWYHKLWNAVKRLWDGVKGYFAKDNGAEYADLSVFDAYEKMSVQEIGDRLYDLLMGGKQLPKFDNTNSVKTTIRERKSDSNREDIRFKIIFPAPQIPRYTGQGIDKYAQEMVEWNNYKRLHSEMKLPAIPKPPILDAPLSIEDVAFVVNSFRSQVSEVFKDVNKEMSKIHELYTAFIDRARPLEKYLQLMKEKGAKIESKTDAYIDFMTSASRATHLIQEYEKTRIAPLQNTLRGVVKKLKKITASPGTELSNYAWNVVDERTGEVINNKKISAYDRISLYLQAKDIVEAADLQGVAARGAEGFENNVHDENGKGVKPQDYIDEFEKTIGRETVDKIWQQVRAVNQWALDLQREYGLIDAETYAEYSGGKRQFYVPQRGWRERDLDDRTLYYKDDKESSPDNPFNVALVKAKGRSTLAGDPLAYMQSIGESTVMQAMKNGTKQKFLEFAETNSDFARVHDFFAFKQVYYVATGNVDADGNMTYERTYERPDEAYFEGDKHAREILEGLQEQREKITKELQAGKIKKSAYNRKMEQITNREKFTINSIHVKYADSEASRIAQVTAKERKQHSVVVLRDGKEYEIIFSQNYGGERVANVLNRNFGKPGDSDLKFMENINDRLRKGTRFMSSMMTQYNPSFALANAIRDWGIATISGISEQGAGYTLRFQKNIVKVQSSVWKYAAAEQFDKPLPNPPQSGGSKYDAYLKEFFEDGSATGWSFLKDIEQLRTKMKRAIDPRTADFVLYGKLGICNAFGMRQTFGMLTEVSELTTRFATYVTSRETKNDDSTPKYTREECAIHAKEVSTNFDRKGNQKFFGTLFSFFNASIQGTNKLFRMIRNKRVRKALAATSATLVVGGLLQALLMPDPDDDDERVFTEWELMNNVCFGKVKFPLPQGLRAFWGVGTQAGLAARGMKGTSSAILDGTKYFFGELVPEQFIFWANGIEIDDKTEKFTFNPTMAVRGAVPTTLQPMYDVWQNTNFMGGTSYRTEFTNAMRDTKAERTMGKRNVSEAAQALSDWLWVKGGGDVKDGSRLKSGSTEVVNTLFDVNPSIIETLTRGYAAGTGKFVMDMYTLADQIIDPDKKADVSRMAIANVLWKQPREYSPLESKTWTLRDKTDFTKHSSAKLKRTIRKDTKIL